MEEEGRQKGRQRTRMNPGPHIYCRLHLNLISPQVARVSVYVRARGCECAAWIT